jgi:plasmid stabilization system protein ParE
MPYEVVWSRSADEHIEQLFDYLAEHVSIWDAGKICERLISCTDKLAEFPRLYAEVPAYGEGVRRIGLLGQNVLYEVDDRARRVTILAVVGQRQQSKRVR